jgi:hypothetical protein
MMFSFTIRNTVILALFQIGVIGTGVLGSAACYKWYITFGLPPPLMTTIVAEYGFFGLMLPVIWSAFAFRALSRGEEAVRLKWVSICAGIALLFLLLLFVGYVAARPLLRLLGPID